MGGGGVMRAAAKVAGFGVNGGLRGSPSVPLAENSVTTAARKSMRIPAGIVSSPVTEDGKSVVLLSSQSGKLDTPASVQKASWEINDWEFAGDQEELLLDSMNPMPRLIFGGVPTLEEATEATSELKDALDKVYFSSTTSESGSSATQERALSMSSDFGSSETKACITGETAVIPSVPCHALQAFSMLREIPVVKNVVASIACDKRVYNAVMQNEEVMKFIHSQKTSAHSPDLDVNVKESFEGDGFLDEESSKNTENTSETKHSESSGNSFRGFFRNIKLTVIEMVSNISGLFQNIFGGSTAEKESVDANGNAAEMAMGASFMALAVLAIMVVLLKRG